MMKRLLWLKSSKSILQEEDDLTTELKYNRKNLFKMDGIVRLERRALGGFGFSVIGGVDTHLPPMICAVVQNGSAHLSGRVSLNVEVSAPKPFRNFVVNSFST